MKNHQNTIQRQILERGGAISDVMTFILWCVRGEKDLTREEMVDFMVRVALLKAYSDSIYNYISFLDEKTDIKDSEIAERLELLLEEFK